MATTPSSDLGALLFAAGEPLSKKRLATILNISATELRDAAITLRDQITGSGLALVEAGEDIELRTAPEASEVIKKFREGELSKDLGKAGLEALAVILYKGGATRSEIDWVRGVNSAAALRSLQLRGLIHREETTTDRRRIRYSATTEALAHLGIESMADLPRREEFTVALAASNEATLADQTA
jgi:segregation and condensation protein B